MIIRNVDVGRDDAKATMQFNEETVSLLCLALPGYLLSDVKKIANRMGLKVGNVYAAKTSPIILMKSAVKKFREVFPGRGHITDSDIAL